MSEVNKLMREITVDLNKLSKLREKTIELSGHHPIEKDTSFKGLYSNLKRKFSKMEEYGEKGMLGKKQSSQYEKLLGKYNALI
jgi:hypothetical protein